MDRYLPANIHDDFHDGGTSIARDLGSDNGVGEACEEGTWL